MSFVRDIFYATAGLSLATLTAGTIAAPIANCSSSFCLSPVLNVGSQILGISTQTTYSEPIAASINSGDNQVHHPVLAPDFRLSVCPVGSTEPTTPELPLTLVKEFRKRIQQGVTFSSLPDLQLLLGTPHCNYRDGNKIRWRYLVRGNGFIDADELNGQVKITIQINE
jgi:hypothetical protein